MTNQINEEDKLINIFAVIQYPSSPEELIFIGNVLGKIEIDLNSKLKEISTTVIIVIKFKESEQELLISTKNKCSKIEKQLIENEILNSIKSILTKPTVH